MARRVKDKTKTTARKLTPEVTVTDRKGNKEKLSDKVSLEFEDLLEEYYILTQSTDPEDTFLKSDWN